MDPKKDLQHAADEDASAEQETQKPQQAEVETTPMGQTDLEQDERDDTDPGD
jgi:hypothetical protein